MDAARRCSVELVVLVVAAAAKQNAHESTMEASGVHGCRAMDGLKHDKEVKRVFSLLCWSTQTFHQFMIIISILQLRCSDSSPKLKKKKTKFKKMF